MPSDRATRENPWHIVLVLDDSESMRGDGARFLNEGLAGMTEEMRLLNKGKFDRIFLSAIKFGSDTTVLFEHQPETQINVDVLAGFQGNSGNTAMDRALHLAADILERHPGKPTDFEPYVFVFTDGLPNSESLAEAAADRVRSLTLPAGKPRIACIGCGAAVQTTFLDKIASNELTSVHLVNPAAISQFFTVVGSKTSTSGGADAIDRMIAEAGSEANYQG